MPSAAMCSGYGEMLGLLFGARRLGVRFELERVRRALALLGEPERGIGPVVLVGGTNGKGSTAACIDSCLRATGLRTGLFTSPHLARFTERIRIGGQEVEAERLVGSYHRIRRAVANTDDLTFFEWATLLGILSFAESATEVTVLEVGLGGRLDATNAVEPAVSVVTGVAYDHQDVLGPDLAAIAGEKAGIFRHGRPAVIGSCGLAAGRELLEAAAVARGASPVVLVTGGRQQPLLPGCQLALGGEHQLDNAACALAALDALELATGVRVAEAERLAGLARVSWPGRLETIAEAPRIVLDGAHNPHAAAALAQALAGLPRRRLLAVIGASSDKDVAGVLAPVLAMADRVWLTRAPNPRSLPAGELLAIAAQLSPGGCCRLTAEPEPAAAVSAARREAAAEDCIVVYGSLFLVGAVRCQLLGEPADPLVVQDPPAASALAEVPLPLFPPPPPPPLP